MVTMEAIGNDYLEKRSNRPALPAKGLPAKGHEDVANGRLTPAGQKRISGVDPLHSGPPTGHLLIHALTRV